MSRLVVLALFLHFVSGNPTEDINIIDIPADNNATDVRNVFLSGSFNSEPENRENCLPCCSCPSIPSITESPSKLVFRDDYQYTEGIGAHKLHTTTATWGDARTICMSEGGNLVVVNSRMEALLLKDLHEKSEKTTGRKIRDQAHIGIHDLFKEGDWVTVHGAPLGNAGYTLWSDKWGGQPDNLGGKEHCGSLYVDSGFNDAPCDLKLPFFCELPIE